MQARTAYQRRRSRLPAWLRLLAAILLGLLLAVIVLKYLPQFKALTLMLERSLGGDSVLHMVVGALLPGCFGILSRLYHRTRWQQFMVYCGFLALYGLDELFQSLFPYRAAEWSDFLCSATGWGIGLIGWFLLFACCWPNIHLEQPVEP